MDRRDGVYWDRVAALAATFTAVLALAVSAYTAYLQRKQTMSAVWPHVEAGWSWGRTHFAVHLENKGIGPATLESLDLSVKGLRVRTWLAFAQALGGDAHLEGHCATNEVLGQVLTAGSSETAFQCEIDDATRAKWLAAIVTAEVTVCYCSVYEECWIGGNQRGTERVGACPGRGPDSFVQIDFADPRSKALFLPAEVDGGDGAAPR